MDYKKKEGKSKTFFAMKKRIRKFYFLRERKNCGIIFLSYSLEFSYIIISPHHDCSEKRISEAR